MPFRPRTCEAWRQYPDDGENVIDGLECKVCYAGNLGMHPRDLYLLADILEAPEEVDQFQWVTALAR